ncbi:glycosyltransferase [Lactobacillus pentosus]|uniref:bifunctional glycosyltransferase/CDP-glycerol:glycerophosphate glycerophosphotransferase n=1 Tax=Lactiplantibacillus pentosus TaxID=1589 RepID=UPI0014254372|nr:bifunctional glycosyltransferase family 2 protein/CDP-glycerol:glycerophosphate glycerophosphotransferase [Lactiplantibacillus pentosus]MCT3292235.1 CDP-glycerol:glycerophosphate glycerophosphotransferase [Lactiplantibacillus pentosus]MPQ17788.1 glycosyltransferase [Lactiplantibacillus pentosus]UXI97601.1 bifunctional glycosyltransferase family 2 protein/CDP-glycerol:glycerophosphate glycerophosphotransferase [Lactiplantibacillus pentosus]BBM21474.1 CDP-glycerol:poly(glycerophosphate) glycer
MKDIGLVKQVSNRLSVVVACYNVAEYLPECLDSILAQSFNNLEVILIDDCSDDGTAEIVDDYAQQHVNFKAVHNADNLGPSASRNLGITLATGDWLAFVDGDDILPVRAYELMMGSLIKSKSQVATGFVRRFDSKRNKQSFLHKKAIIDDYRHATFADHPELLYDTTSWNKIYSLPLLRENDITFPTGQIYEDVSFTLNAFLKSTGIDILTDVVYNWRWRENGTKASFTQVKNELPKYLDRITSVNQVKALLQAHDLWHGQIKQQVVFKLLDLDIPLFMDDIADADESFVYQFQETTINFFRSWGLLKTPILKQLSVKKQSQYYALIHGEFEVLKRISANAFSGRAAQTEKKDLGIPNFHAPKSLTTRLTRVRRVGDSIVISGSLQLGKQVPRHFPHNPEVVKVYLENLVTGDRLPVTTFKRQFTMFNLHLRRMPVPSSKFTLVLDMVQANQLLSEGTYKIRIDYQATKTDKVVTTYLGQPRKGAGRIAPFEIDGQQLSVVYGYNTNWQITIGLLPTENLAVGSKPNPTLLTKVRLDSDDALIVEGRTSEAVLALDVNGIVIGEKQITDGKFTYRIDSKLLKRFLNHAVALTFTNPETGVTVVPDFKFEMPTPAVLFGTDLSVALNPKLGKGLWIQPDVAALMLSKADIQMKSDGNHLILQFDNDTVANLATTGGKIELLSTNLVNRYLNGGIVTRQESNRLVGDVLLNQEQQLAVLAGKYQLYLDLKMTDGNNRRFRVYSYNLTSEYLIDKTKIAKATTVSAYTDKFGYLKLSVIRKRPWIDRTKIRRGLSFSVLYPLMRLLPLKTNTVVFESLWGQLFNDSPRAMYEYLVAQHPSMKFVWVFKDEQTPISGPGVRVRRMSFKYWYYMARAKYLVQNTNLPNQYAKRRGQIEVETLHGTFMKVMGFDEPHFKQASNNIQKKFAYRIGRWDLMSVPSDFMLEHGARAFDYPEQKIVTTGFPRTDELIQNNHATYIQKIKHYLGIPADKQVVLYAPTYRTTDEPFDLALDLEQMQAALGNDYVLLMRLHYFVSHSQNFVNQSGFVYDVSDYNNINDLYLISDVLITDYSSVMFDFGYLRKPMVFFAYDKDWYLDPANRGIYMDYDATVPGPVAKTTDDVIEALQHIDTVKVTYQNKMTDFYDRFCQYGRAGDATKRLTEAMLNLKPISQDSVVSHLIGNKLTRLFKLTNLQSQLLNALGQKLPKKNIAIFESFFGRQYSDNPKAIYDYMKANYPQIKAYWNVNKDYEQYFIDHQIPYVTRFSFKGIWKQARAKYWFTNVRRPFRWIKPKGTVVVQTWHGTPLKTIGTDVQQVTMPGLTRMKYHKQVVRDSSRWDYLLTPNPYSYEIMHHAFRKNYAQLLPTGYPRNDRLSTASTADILKIKRHLNIDDDAHVVLYAPTWRDNDFVRADHFRAELHLDLNQFIRETPDNTIILIRTHYMIANNLDLSGYGKRVINVSDYEDISDLYLISDLLITDYSSVFFDYAILKRPMIFYAYDLAAYADDIRGFYVDYESTVPGPIVGNNDELMPLINEAITEPARFIDNEKYHRFLKKFASWEDGQATKRLLSIVFDEQPAYQRREVDTAEGYMVNDQVKIAPASLLWKNIPGLPGDQFAGNFDETNTNGLITINKIGCIVPTNFGTDELYTGGYWINAQVQGQDVWLMMANVSKKSETAMNL